MGILLFSNIEVRVTVEGSDYHQFHEREVEDSPTITDSGRVLLTSMGSEPITQNKAELQNCVHKYKILGPQLLTESKYHLRCRPV